MANPQDTGTFDYWLTGRISFATIPPRTGNTGTFDDWPADRVYFHDYVEAAEEAGFSAGQGAVMLKSPRRAVLAGRSRFNMLG